MPKSLDFNLVQRSLNEAGFTAVDMEPQDLFLCGGKHRPEMYLDPEFRKGISTFSSLSDSTEVADGCRRLEEDIHSGRIHQVMSEFKNTGGDYLFLIAH